MSDLTPATSPTPPHLAEVTPPPPAAAPAAAVTPPPPAPAPVAVSATPAGWYDDGQGRQRWYDGTQWTDNYAPVQPAPQPVQQPVHTAGPMTAGQLNVNRQVIYNREQKGHSIILHLLLGIFVLYINVIYISVSPNHYWHA